jgi:DNA-binding transcriptional MerR regulator
MAPTQLTVDQVAQIAGCHRSTVLRYERKGIIRSLRDIRNYRRFALNEALRLREILETLTSGATLHHGAVDSSSNDLRA